MTPAPGASTSSSARLPRRWRFPILLLATSMGLLVAWYGARPVREPSQTLASVSASWRPAAEVLPVGRRAHVPRTAAAQVVAPTLPSDRAQAFALLGAHERDTGLAMDDALAALALTSADQAVRAEAAVVLAERLVERRDLQRDSQATPVGAADATDTLVAIAWNDPEARVRIQAIQALGRIADMRAVAALSAMLRMDEPALRLEAVDALGLIGGEAIEQPLREASGDESALVREAASQWLQELAVDARRLARNSG